MPRYIDADKVVKWSYSEPRYSDSVNDRTDLRDFLLSLPTISPDEVRGVGRWVGEYDGSYDGEPVWDMWSCSNCGEYFDEWDDKPTWAYCPSCGAKMEVTSDD